MPINKPALDSRKYREILTATVMIVSFILTILYPDTVPIAYYFVQPGASTLRDSSILITRAVMNTITWGIATYVLVRVAERLRHKNR
ncbi:hypothetical protein EU527_15865 [Candidatus Thorarchaeota archaeon]|nr:MAG: hypothetical protein EU527_15865 [Candidatus Thorarchaeota archaeon]